MASINFFQAYREAKNRFILKHEHYYKIYVHFSADNVNLPDIKETRVSTYLLIKKKCYKSTMTSRTCKIAGL